MLNSTMYSKVLFSDWTPLTLGLNTILLVKSFEYISVLILNTDRVWLCIIMLTSFDNVTKRKTKNVVLWLWIGFDYLSSAYRVQFIFLMFCYQFDVGFWECRPLPHQIKRQETFSFMHFITRKGFSLNLNNSTRCLPISTNDTVKRVSVYYPKLFSISIWHVDLTFR